MLEALHQVQGAYGSQVSVFYVRLADGDLISVDAPALTPFTQGARVKVLEHIKESARKSYVFVGYLDPGSNPAAGSDALKTGVRSSP